MLRQLIAVQWANGMSQAQSDISPFPAFCSSGAKDRLRPAGEIKRLQSCHQTEETSSNVSAFFISLLWADAPAFLLFPPFYPSSHCLSPVMPRFAEQVEVAIEALSTNPPQGFEENEFIDASRLVYDGVRDIRKAVLMIRVRPFISLNQAYIWKYSAATLFL